MRPIARSRVFAVAALGSAAGYAGILRWAPWMLSGRAEAVLMALVFVLWPLLYAGLVGWRMRPVRPLLVAVLGGVLFGQTVLPSAEMHFWRFVEELRWAASAVLLVGELWVLWLLVSSLARLRGTDAPDAAIAGVVAQHLGHGMAARWAVVELRMWFYALLAWGRTNLHYTGDVFFTTHRHQGNASTLQGLLILTTAELPIVHGLVWLWSPRAAWIVTALSLYGLVWLLGEYRATQLRPVSMDAQWLYLRYGLLGDERIPLQAIAAVQPWTQRLRRRAGLIQHRAHGRPNLRLVLRSPVPVTRLSGDTTVDAIVLALDDPVSFSRTLMDRLPLVA